MSERGETMDEATLKFGLLMESAQAHQKFAETQLEKLRAHTDDLDGVVRDEIRRTLVDELKMLTAESARAVRVFKTAGRGAFVRAACSSLVMALMVAGVSAGFMRWGAPTEAQVASLRSRRDQLAANIAQLERRGGRAEWRNCGAAARLCIRIDRSAPAYGDKADFYVVAGY